MTASRMPDLQGVQQNVCLGLKAGLKVLSCSCHQALIESLLSRLHGRECLLEAAQILSLLDVSSLLALLPAGSCCTVGNGG